MYRKDEGIQARVLSGSCLRTACVKLRPRKGRELHPALPALTPGIEQSCSTLKTGSGKTLPIGYRMASGGREGTGEKWGPQTCTPH